MKWSKTLSRNFQNKLKTAKPDEEGLNSRTAVKMNVLVHHISEQMTSFSHLI